MDLRMIAHFQSYTSHPGGHTISALLGSPPWASLVEYHVYRSWALGAHPY